jgi:urease accessory protein
MGGCAGGHAHSGGIKPRPARATSPIYPLWSFLRGRLATAGLVSAAFAAAATHRVHHGDLSALDRALDARHPPLAAACLRAQGRALLRAGRAMWAVTAEMGHTNRSRSVLSPRPLDSAQRRPHSRRYASVTGPATAAVRLLGLDPYGVQGLLAGLAPDCDRTAALAAAFAACGVDELPAASAPLLDILAEAHATWEVRLFAS